jgi:hypothetical protein
VVLGFQDQQNLARQFALQNGCPNIRWIDVPRMGSGAERVAAFYDKVMKSLMDPLTAKEKESGVYNPPPDPRVMFTGTLDDAQTFFQQSTPTANCKNCPIAKYTDGLPIIIPTEEKVKEMLTGTKHKPDETVYLYTMNATSKQVEKRTTPLIFTGMGWTGTVEKVAVNAVMAGCKPEYLPTVLAVACTGGW